MTFNLLEMTGKRKGEIKELIMNTKELENLSIGELVEVYNKHSGKKPIKKFRTKADALRRTAEVLPKEAPAEKQKPSGSKTGAKRGRPSFLDDDAKIFINVIGNPKRVGSAAHARFDLYRAGMTVAEAIEAGLRYADLNWDISAGFIDVK